MFDPIDVVNRRKRKAKPKRATFAELLAADPCLAERIQRCPPGVAEGATHLTQWTVGCGDGVDRGRKGGKRE